MSGLLDWLRAAPPNAIPLATAGLAAVIAVIVAVLTQWILGRRARTDLLTKKLEELYLLLLQWMDDAAATKITIDELVKSQPLSAEQRSTVLTGYSQPRADRRVSMYIDLYFPPLNRFKSDVFEANRAFSSVVRKMGQGEKTTAPDIQRAFLALYTALTPLSREIVDNRVFLTRKRMISPSYKRSSGEANDA